MNSNSIVYRRQKPLINSYLATPEKAQIVDYARIEGKNFDDPFHTSLILNDETENTLDVGLHRAIGGLHDIANPGDLLCGALAACFESSLRMIANRIGITITNTNIVAKAYVDVRGTLQIDKDVEVGFQKFSLDVELEVKENTKSTLVNTLIKGAKYSCVVYQTLKKGIPIEVNIQTPVVC